MIALILALVVMIVIDCIQQSQIKKLRTALRKSREGCPDADNVKSRVIDYTD